jgi:hypothetical protein
LGKGEKMGIGLVKPSWIGFMVISALLMLGETPRSFGQQVTWGKGRYLRPEPCPISPDFQPGPPAPSDQAPSVDQVPGEPTLAPERFAALEGESVALATPNMIGDVLFPSGTRRVIVDANGQTHSFVLPAAGHGFKIADDGNPLPQDRVYVGENFYNNVNSEANRRVGSDVGIINVNRVNFGFEKTILEGNFSLSVFFPLNTLSTEGSTTPGLGGAWTDIGNLTVVLKGVLWQDRSLGNAVSAGLAVTFPTGADSFARVGSVTDSINNTSLQPFLALILNSGDFFVMGFSAVEIPTDSNDVTLFFNDIGIGYYAYRTRQSERHLTAVIPTVELHGNTPLNHRGLFNGPAGTQDWLDVTGGATFIFKERTSLAVGVATPVTGLKPFDVEGIVQVNVHF